MYINVYVQPMERRLVARRRNARRMHHTLYESIMSTLLYIYSRRNVAESSIEFSAKMELFWLFCLLSTHTKCPHIQTIAGYVPARSIVYPSCIYKGISLYRERVTLLFLVMVFVDKSYVTTSMRKPDAQLQFRLTINYM